MENEKIIQTIKKVLELSKNNPSEEEAKTAALMAQKLLAKYHIDIAEVEGIEDVDAIDEVSIEVPARKWKYTLADIVAKNFRCKHFWYGKGKVVFYGYKTDAEIAKEMFKYLFTMGDKGAHKEIRKSYDTTNVYNSYVKGFCDGLESALGEQSVALALVIPDEVKSAYKERSKNFAVSHFAGISAYRSSAYNSGVVDGRSAIGRKQIAGG